MAQQTHDAWDEKRKIWRDYKTFYQGSGRVLLVVVGILAVKAIFQSESNFVENFSMEALSLLATVLVLDWLAERRDERRSERELKARLVMEAGSQSNEAAKRAVDELQHRGWLEGEDGLLKGASLRGANLENANLQEANLQSANLVGANLHSSILYRANLHGTILVGASLHGVNLKWANLQGAILYAAHLQGANLRGADLEGANVSIATFDVQTILPDGSNWTSATVVSRFTDPLHSDFWRSDDPDSPAYRGEAPTAE